MKPFVQTLRSKAVLLATAMLILVSGTAQGESATMSAAQTEKKLLTSVYVFDGSKVKYRDADAADINQMFYSFALIHNGRVSTAHWKNFKKFRAYVQKHPNIFAILSVGGWGADGFSQPAATAESREAFVAEVLQVMEQHGFRGVDIDWEYPGSSAAGIQSSPNDRHNYTLLLQTLRKGLDNLSAADGVQRKLCVALSGSPEMTASIECEAVGQIVDQVNLMTYDLQQPDVASHHTALYASYPGAISASACVQAYLDAGIPAEKLMLGVAFYGHRWTTKNKEPLYQPATEKDTPSYGAIAKLIRKTPDAVRFDEVAQASYFLYKKTFISYDDERSITQKRHFAQEHHLMGLFAWEYGLIADGALVQAMGGSASANP